MIQEISGLLQVDLIIITGIIVKGKKMFAVVLASCFLLIVSAVFLLNYPWLAGDNKPLTKIYFNGKILDIISIQFGLWSYLSSFSMAEQFIGSYRLDIFTSQDGRNYNNIISDSKSRSSLFYNADISDKNRSKTNTMGTTYQFYIWKSPVKK